MREIRIFVLSLQKCKIKKKCYFAKLMKLQTIGMALLDLGHHNIFEHNNYCD